MKSLIIIIVSILVLGFPVSYYLSSEDIEITVTKTERINQGEESKYLVYTENETFENTDSWLYLKFDSSDLYGQMKSDQTYKVKVAGWRWKFFSSYRNIVVLEE